MTFEEAFHYAIDTASVFIDEEIVAAANMPENKDIFAIEHPLYGLLAFIYPNLFLKEKRDEYDRIIDPITGVASNWLELPTTIVTQDMVSGGGITVLNLDTVAGEGYSDRSWMPTTDWMAAILGD